MSAHKTAQYQAYSAATRTAPKTRQIVLLYDGAIRFMKQAKRAIHDRRIEDRFRLLSRVSDIIVGLQSSIDFENGGEIAQTLSRFYTNLAVRVLSVNHRREEGESLCDSILDDLKQMRDVWDNIDRNFNAAPHSEAPPFPMPQTAAANANVTISA